MQLQFLRPTGAVWAYYKPGELDFIASADQTLYSASDGLNRHYFCARCGSHIWGDAPDWASVYNLDGTSKTGEPDVMPSTRIHTLNLKLVDDLDWSALTVEPVDGRNNW